MDKILLLLFIFIRIFSSPVASIFQKKLSSIYSSFTINFYTYFILSILCLYNCKQLISFDYTVQFIVLVFSCGFLCTIGMLCMIKAVNIGEISVLGPINSYKSIIGLIIAFFLLKEIPSITALIGVILIIFGSRYIFIDEKNGFNFSLLKRKDIQLRFLAMTLTAIEAVLLKKIIIISSVEICFMFWCFMGLFWSFLLLLLTGKPTKVNSFKSFVSIFVISLCLGLMQYSTNFVFERMDVGLSLSVFQLSSIVTVLFGWKIFKETNIRLKLFGCLIMIIGSCLILIK